MKNGLWIILMVLLLATGCSAYTSSPRTGYYPDAGGQYGGEPQQYPQQQYGQPYGQEYGDDMDMDSMYNYLCSLWELGSNEALRLCLDPQAHGIPMAALQQRPLGHDRIRLDLDRQRAVGRDPLPLRPLGL